MARAHRVGPDGVELDLIGQPLHLRPGPAPGVTFTERETMTKAPFDGKFLLNGHQFKMRQGKELPEGAVPVPMRMPPKKPIEATHVIPGTEGIELDPDGGNQEFITLEAVGELPDGFELKENLIDPDTLTGKSTIELVGEGDVDEKKEPAATETKAVPAAPENKAEKPPSNKAEKKGE